MNANDPHDETLWIPAFAELGDGLQKAATTRAGARSYLPRWMWLAGVAAVAVVPGGLALALNGDEGEPPTFGTPAPAPLETQIGNSVTCANGDVVEVTQADFQAAIADLPPIPSAPDAGPSDGLMTAPPPGPLGFKFVCGPDGDLSVVEITK